MEQKLPKKPRKTKYDCQYCGKPLQSTTTLLSHTVSKHPDKLAEVLSKIQLPEQPASIIEQVDGEIREVTNKAVVEEKKPIAMKQADNVDVSFGELLKQKKTKITNLQKQINQLNAGGDEMAETNLQPAELRALEATLRGVIGGLEHSIADTKKDLALLRDEKIPQKIKDTMEPLTDKMTNLSVEATKSTASLSDTLKDLQKSLSDQVAKQAEATKQETEALKSELAETTKKTDSISTLGDELKTSITGVLDEKTKEWDEKLSQLPTEEKVKELVDACILDPESGACKRLDELEKSTRGESELEKSAHSTAAELLACPTCGVAVTKRIMAALSEQGKSEIADSFLAAMSDAGYSTGAEPKPEEPVPAEEPAPEEEPAVPAGF